MDLLFVHWNMNPEIFRIGSFAVRWYGLLFVSGFILGYWMFARFFKREKVNETLLDPLLYTLLIGTLVGARLGHCIFYQPDYYFGSWKGFLEIFAVWHGGLASCSCACGGSRAGTGRRTTSISCGFWIIWP